MKKFFYYLTLFVALMMGATVFSSCGDDDSEQPLPPEPDGIPYVAWDDAQNKIVKKYLTEKIDTIKNTANSNTMTGGWYFVEDSVKIKGDINVLDDVHLILADSASLDVQGTVDGQTGRENIYIYTQSEYPNKIPQITITSRVRTDCNGVNGNVTVNGGMVKVISNGYGSYAVHGNLTVCDGYVELIGAYGVGGDLIVAGCRSLAISSARRAVCGTITSKDSEIILCGDESNNPRFAHEKITSGTSSNYRSIIARFELHAAAARRY